MELSENIRFFSENLMRLPGHPSVFEHHESCEEHGKYQSNVVDKNGVERFLPGCPACSAKKRSESLLSRSAIPVRFVDRSLSNYVAETLGQQRALKISQEFAVGFAFGAGVRGTCLTFFGKPGTGKTHLACGIANQIMRNGHSALFVTVSDAIRAVRATWRRDSKKTEGEVLGDFSSVDLLIIDEVGVQYGTDAEQNTLFEIINRRYSNKKPMILLSNLPVKSEDPKQKTLRDFLGDRSFDRLREGGGRIVTFDWDSYRSKAVVDA